MKKAGSVALLLLVACGDDTATQATPQPTPAAIASPTPTPVAEKVCIPAPTKDHPTQCDSGRPPVFDGQIVAAQAALRRSHPEFYGEGFEGREVIVGPHLYTPALVQELEALGLCALFRFQSPDETWVKEPNREPDHSTFSEHWDVLASREKRRQEEWHGLAATCVPPQF